MATQVFKLPESLKGDVKYSFCPGCDHGVAVRLVAEVLDELGLHDSPIFKLALALEKIALEDEYFISRNLYPNVDFYSGILQKAIGIPMPLFTANFAMASTVGWFAQLNEMIDDPAFRIGRPRQLFTGSTERHVKPIEER